MAQFKYNKIKHIMVYRYVMCHIIMITIYKHIPYIIYSTE